MSRGGSKERQAGVRRCIVTGEGAEKSALIRFVLSPENIVTPDVLERLEGRGVWVSADRQVLEQAKKKNAFARSFKTQLIVPDDLVANVEKQLTGRLIALLGIARKAGEAISGQEKVSQALQNGEVTLLFQASDGSEREKRNLSYRNEVEYRFECLNRSELGMAFSKDNVVHAALTGAGLKNRVRDEAKRLTSLRSA